MTGLWYDAPESAEEARERTDRYGNRTRPEPTPFDRVVDRAYELVRPAMTRPPRGIAMPFGLEHRDSMKWRLSPDVRKIIVVGSTGYVGVSIIPREELFGVRVEVDYTAPLGTLDLIEEPE